MYVVHMWVIKVITFWFAGTGNRQAGSRSSNHVFRCYYISSSSNHTPPCWRHVVCDVTSKRGDVGELAVCCCHVEADSSRKGQHFNFESAHFRSNIDRRFQEPWLDWQKNAICVLIILFKRCGPIHFVWTWTVGVLVSGPPSTILAMHE